MRSSSLPIIVAVLIAIAGSPARAERHTLSKAKISVDLPSSWKITKDKRGLFARSADGGVALVFWETHAADFKVIDDAEGRLAMSEIRWTDYGGREVENGISWALRNTGTAKVDQKPVLARLLVGGGKDEKIGVYVLVAAKPTEQDTNTAIVDKVFKSLRYQP